MKNTIKILSCLVFLTFCCMVYGQDTYYVCNDAKERSWSTISNSGNYTLNGPPKTLTFEAKRTAILGFSNDTEFYAEYSTDGRSWTNALKLTLSKTDQWYNFSCDLPDNTTYIRFETKTGATGYKQIRNVKVTRATTLSSETTSLDLGNVELNKSASKTITVGFNNTYSEATLSGSCTNSSFTVVQESMGETGSKAITIRFNPTSAGNQSGTVTLTMGTVGKNNNVSYQFNVSGKGINGDMYPGNITEYSPGTYSKVTLHRSLPAGLSTIALPFNTTIEALAGNGNGKAYTLSNVGYDQNQGYLFYFAEVAELEAGKPYLIKLTNQAVNPVWDNVTVGALTPVTITRGGWDFTANFTPAKNMDGSYGVVNSQSKIMKGGPSSFINAFGAYFQLNQAVSSSSKTSSSEDYPISDSQQRMTIILQ